MLTEIKTCESMQVQLTLGSVTQHFLISSAKLTGQLLGMVNLCKNTKTKHSLVPHSPFLTRLAQLDKDRDQKNNLVQ